ncbi:MAG: glutathione-disulfide reductase [Rhodobacteraceae bacterium]|nr:glutathione-disulfide reductase [Paracoccaceae bacterium]
MGFDVDLFVIGGGSGGVRAARVAAAEGGARVALAEESRMGGTCVIRGCVPKKLMVFAAAFGGAIADAREYGWQTAPARFDWSAFRPRLAAELDRLEGVYRGLLARAGVAIHDQRATVEDPHTVRLAGGGRVSARHILVATGGHAVRPAIPGAGLGLVSDDLFGLAALPASILIVGGGYIAVEFATILAGLGVRVTLAYRGAQILRGFDDEARDHVARLVAAQGIAIRVTTEVARLEPDPAGGVRAHLAPGGPETFGAVLFATGRAPRTAGLGLEAAGVALGRRGEVLVDEWSQTAVPSIFAVGDVTDRMALTPVAIREGQAFAETVFKANPVKATQALVATAVFTRPEFGTVGLTEAEAAAAGPVAIYATTFRPMHRAFAGRAEQVLMKLVVCARSRRVLGCHIVADQAGEMIQLAAVAMGMGATKEDFDRAVAVHPTMAEELVTMRNPVRVRG